VSSFADLEIAGLLRVLNEQRELLFYCDPQVALRHIEFGDARWEETRKRKHARKQKHKILIWQGPAVIPASQIVVHLGPGHSKSYERMIAWRVQSMFRELPYIVVLLEIGAELVIHKVHTPREIRAMYIEPVKKPVVLPLRPPVNEQLKVAA
jgi:hypothetical protein